MIEIERSSGNVYEDLGVENPEEMLIKAQLVGRIQQIIADRGWKQQEAARVIGMSQPKLSNMLRGHFHGITEFKMMEYLRLLGCDVQIVVGPSHLPEAGRLGVVMA